MSIAVPLDPALASARWRVLAAGVCALILTVGLARFAYTPMLPIMRAQAGLSDLAGGWLATFSPVLYTVLNQMPPQDWPESAEHFMPQAVPSSAGLAF